MDIQHQVVHRPVRKDVRAVEGKHRKHSDQFIPVQLSVQESGKTKYSKHPNQEY